MHKRNVLFFAIAAFVPTLLIGPTTVFAQCVINGFTYAEGTLSQTCSICDSSRSSTEWSDVICPVLADVDSACQISTCVKNTGCASTQLPERTRCTDPVCQNGSITQTECTSEGKCEDVRTKSCQGFSCLNGTSCTTECVDDEDCQSPATCEGQTCQLPVIRTDMGEDMKVSDVGTDVAVKEDLSTKDMTHFDMNVVDMKNDTTTDAGDHQLLTSGGGCRTTGGSSGFSLVLIGFFAMSRRSKKVV